jgi:hypothetical protein
MKSTKVIVLTTLAAVFLLAGVAHGQPITVFPPVAWDDTVETRGRAYILVHEKARGLMDGYQGYDPNTYILESPDLIDSTTIMLSGAHFDGTPLIDGPPGDQVGVQSGPNQISDADFTLVPVGFEGPPGTREVHTEIYDMDMHGGGVVVRAGRAQGVQMSPGEVESHVLPPGPDFPAESFFDVLVEADFPPGGSTPVPAFTVYNKTPLLVLHDSLTQFPPTVVYRHGKTTAVRVYFKNAEEDLWSADALFGYLIIAGHGANVTPVEFEVAMEEAEEEPMQEPKERVPSLTGWGFIIFGALILITGAYYIWRRRQLASSGI